MAAKRKVPEPHAATYDSVGQPVRRVVLAELVAYLGAEHRLIEGFQDVVVGRRPVEAGNPSRHVGDQFVSAINSDHPVEEPCFSDSRNPHLSKTFAGKKPARWLAGGHMQCRPGDESGQDHEVGVFDEELVCTLELGPKSCAQQLRPQVSLEGHLGNGGSCCKQLSQPSGGNLMSRAAGAEPAFDRGCGCGDLRLG
jgi:hypothetical protein